MEQPKLFDECVFQSKDKEHYPSYELLRQELVLTQEEIENGIKQHKKEVVNLDDNQDIFRKIVYCILTPGENYINLKKIYDAIFCGKEGEFLTSNDIASNRRGLENILKRTRYSKRTISAVYGLASNWEKSQLQERILEDIADGRVDEFEIRREMKRDIYGIGLKCASMFLRMCGYENVVPVDIWVLRFLDAQLNNGKYSHLKDQGHSVKVYDYRTVPGLNDKEYLQGEELISIIAKDYGLSPAIFQIVLWTHFASGRDLRIGEDLNNLQYDLF